MRPTVGSLDVRSIQAALDQISRRVTGLLRRGDTEMWAPKMFTLPKKEDVRSPGRDAMAWDSSTSPWTIVRWNGSDWESVT